MTGEEMVNCDVPDKLEMFSYLTQIYEAFRGEIPHIKHPKLVSIYCLFIYFFFQVTHWDIFFLFIKLNGKIK